MQLYTLKSFFTKRHLNHLIQVIELGYSEVNDRPIPIETIKHDVKLVQSGK